MVVMPSGAVESLPTRLGMLQVQRGLPLCNLLLYMSM